MGTTCNSWRSVWRYIPTMLVRSLPTPSIHKLCHVNYTCLGPSSSTELGFTLQNSLSLQNRAATYVDLWGWSLGCELFGRMPVGWAKTLSETIQAILQYRWLSPPVWKHACSQVNSRIKTFPNRFQLSVCSQRVVSWMVRVCTWAVS